MGCRLELTEKRERKSALPPNLDGYLDVQGHGRSRTLQQPGAHVLQVLLTRRVDEHLFVILLLLSSCRPKSRPDCWPA